MREHLLRNRLAILPDLTHHDIFRVLAFAATVLPFLDDVRGSRSWAGQVGGSGEHAASRNH